MRTSNIWIAALLVFFLSSRVAGAAAARPSCIDLLYGGSAKHYTCQASGQVKPYFDPPLNTPLHVFELTFDQGGFPGFTFSLTAFNAGFTCFCQNQGTAKKPRFRGPGGFVCLSASDVGFSQMVSGRVREHGRKILDLQHHVENIEDNLVETSVGSCEVAR